MIIDFSSKVKTESEEHLKQKEEVVDKLKNMVRLAEEGYIVSFACTGFTSEGRMFISSAQGMANPHEINSAINVMGCTFDRIVVNTELKVLENLKSDMGLFNLPLSAKVPTEVPDPDAPLFLRDDVFFIMLKRLHSSRTSYKVKTGVTSDTTLESLEFRLSGYVLGTVIFVTTGLTSSKELFTDNWVKTDQGWTQF